MLEAAKYKDVRKRKILYTLVHKFMYTFVNAFVYTFLYVVHKKNTN